MVGKKVAIIIIFISRKQKGNRENQTPPLYTKLPDIYILKLKLCGAFFLTLTIPRNKCQQQFFFIIIYL